MNNTFSCTACGPIEKTSKVLRGNGVFEIVLWLSAIIPGILLVIEPLPLYYLGLFFTVTSLGYSIWRRRSAYLVCVKCQMPLAQDWQPTNRPAVAGLLSGLMLHVPLITGISALILGLIGRGRAKATKGQGASIAKLAIILGAVNIAGWLLISVYIGIAWNPLPPQNTTARQQMPLERKNRPVLIRGIPVLKGTPVRVFVENVDAGGIMASTPTSAYRMAISLSSSGRTAVKLAYAGSEFVLKDPVPLQDALLCGAPNSALFKLTDQGNLIWIAGLAGYGMPVQLTPAAVTSSDCLRLLMSSQDLDREEGAFSAANIANINPADRRQLLRALEVVLTDKAEDVRRCAAEALAKIGDESVVVSLKHCAESDASGWVREIAQESLRKIAPEIEVHPTPLVDKKNGIKISGNVSGSINLGGKTVSYYLDPVTGRGNYWFPRLFDLEQ